MHISSQPHFSSEDKSTMEHVNRSEQIIRTMPLEESSSSSVGERKAMIRKWNSAYPRI